MGLEIYMVGVICADIRRSVEFYRRLGVDIPAGSEEKEHVEVKMGGMTFFLQTKRRNAWWDPARTDATGGYRMILEFYLKTREAVDAKYAEMLGYGYEPHHEPYPVSAELYFALINDPDGNKVLISAFEGDGA